LHPADRTILWQCSAFSSLESGLALDVSTRTSLFTKGKHYRSIDFEWGLVQSSLFGGSRYVWLCGSFCSSLNLYWVLRSSLCWVR